MTAVTPTAHEKESAWTRFVPVLSWLPKYQWKKGLTTDAIAGFTIWGLLIPEMIAYASLAGLPPQAGLYTLLASLVVYAIFGTSRQLVVAGTSASAILVGATIAEMHPSSAVAYADLAAGMILLGGLIFVIAGLCKLGFITTFLSRPVMSGFVFGLAIFIAVSQLPKLFGLSKGGGDTVEQFFHLLGDLGSASWLTFGVGLVALVLLFGLERFLPRLPGGLIVLVLGIGVSSAFDLSSHGVKTVGEIPSGLPSLVWPDLTATQLWVLIPSAIGMVLVIFSEALGAGQTFAEKHHYRLDTNQELIALGLANLGSGVLGGLACGGSMSETAVNDGAGARSAMSLVVAAVLALVTIIALTPLFTDLPEAILGALIIHAVSHLMKVGEMRKFYALVRTEFWLGLITLLSVIVIDVLPGLLIGIGLSIIVYVGRVSRPHVSVMGQDPKQPGVFEDVQRNRDAVPVPGVLIVRPDAPLFYANAQGVRDHVDALLASAQLPVRYLVMILDANDDLDLTGTEMLERLDDHLREQNIAFGIAHLHGPARARAERTGLVARIGADHFFGNTQEAVAWASSSQPAADGRGEITSAQDAQHS
jgi:high affinity sulfate transporter 1